TSASRSILIICSALKRFFPIKITPFLLMFYHNTNFKGGSVFRGRVSIQNLIKLSKLIKMIFTSRKEY
ncbi:MAG: hypothetical protein QF907_05595, partial [Nitrospinota bacterium]|nr:hypothetical protein [Nitrospinota bacterium]